MKNVIVPFGVALFLINLSLRWTDAKIETIIKVPYKDKNSIWRWSWTSQWTRTLNKEKKIYYYACDVNPSSEPKKWIRSDVFHSGDVKKVYVTVEYAVSKCSTLSLKYCKEKLYFHIFSTDLQRRLPPEPWNKPAFYGSLTITSQAIATYQTLSPRVATNESFIFYTHPSTPYYYFAILHRGGCQELYSVTIRSSICPSFAFSSLVQLPRTVPPTKGLIKVLGTCVKNALRMGSDFPPYGLCHANGKWMRMVGLCSCKAGYGLKYLNGSGSLCKACPLGTFQDSMSMFECKPCPLNSVQDASRKKCNCAPSFYRTKNETIFDSCTAPPSAPQYFKAIFISATSAVLLWKIPSDLGGRSDQFYEVKCKKCDEKGQNCNEICSGIKIIHFYSISVTVKHLSPYTYYQFKVFAKNGVTLLAEKNGEKPKYAVFTERTSEWVCPLWAFQDIPGISACKPCPLNSVHDMSRKKCNCAPSFYRTKNETIFDSCTAPPSAPQNFRAVFISATSAILEWKIPSDLGGRSDQFYEVECKKCDDKGQNCNGICPGIKIIHSSKNSTSVTVKHLSPFTYYQFKVFAKNEVTHLADSNGEKPKFAVFTERTSESVPGAPVLKISLLSPTSVLLSWNLVEKNGVITFYQIMYYPDGESSMPLVHNTTDDRITITKLSEGTKYYFKVRAATKHGLGQVGSKQMVTALGTDYSKSNNKNTNGVAVPALASTLGVVLLIVVLVVGVYILRRNGLFHKKEERNSHEDDDMEVTNLNEDMSEEFQNTQEERNSHEYDPVEINLDEDISEERHDPWQVPQENLTKIQTLDSGHFGCVDKATAIGLYGCPGKVTVAVKTLKDNADETHKNDFVTELNLMKRMEPHPCIVKLLGYCTTSDGLKCIILEYMPYGDLLGYLRRSRGHESNKLSSQDLLKFAWMIADGMSFLAENGYVHRDLAARNVLVGEDKICKISDFGLARKIRGEIYIRSTVNALLPTRWTPPESLYKSESTIASDVWSYGIVLWEIFTLGDEPYPKINARDLPRMVEEGYRMPKPCHLSETLYTLMLKCWEYKPEDRPLFTMICDKLNTLYNDTKDYINIDAFEVAIYSNFDVLSR